MTQDFKEQTFALIDDLKSVCANYGLGNDGNEFKIITQTFLYKYLNDKFVYEIQKIEPILGDAENLEETLLAMAESKKELLWMELDEDTAILKANQLIRSLYKRQNEANFATVFDNTLLDIATQNSAIFSVVTNTGEKVVLFDRLSEYVTDDKDAFCKAIINKLINFSFSNLFGRGFDFFAQIFEYLIKDYNTNSGGKYAEYFTPHAIAKIMAKCLVVGEQSNKTCYDPSAGSGSLLMNLAHEIGESKCTIYTQDISQKSSHLLRLNLILNNLVHSIPHVVKGNTLTDPYHKDKNGQLEKFDYIVSNPPFNLDFSDWREEVDTKENKERFFAGIPKVPNKKKEKMDIYLLFIQHIMYSLKSNGKAAVVVPTGFIDPKVGIIKKNIIKELVENKWLAGVVKMPSNIFANTGTNVSVLFIDKTNQGDVVLIDASKLGETVKEDKNQKTVLRAEEEAKIIDCFTQKKAEDDFAMVVSYDDIKEKNYSLNAGQYFEVKIEYVHITPEEFAEKKNGFETQLNALFAEGNKLDAEIQKQLKGLRYE